MRLWCGRIGLCCVLRCVYVDRCEVTGNKVGVLWVCDVPISYAKAVDNGYGFAGPCAQMCGAGIWVSE